ncbi:GNAT family N-acetyltransferase [Candidatus Micrarchaeota archaeon]|nr:GNAT family N-acetyltransferase [Candidatus Micrarchaeota archaeon]
MKALSIARCRSEKKLLALINEIFPSATPGFGENDVYFLATLDGEDAGFLHLILHSKGVLLQGIGVREKFRKKGIGGGLMDTALEFAQKENADILLKVKPSNTDALNLYAKKGFSIRKVTDAYVLHRKRCN